MKPLPVLAAVAAIALAVGASACGGAAAPKASSGSQSVAQSSSGGGAGPSPTSVPAAPTAAPTAKPKPATATVAPAPTAANSAISDLISKVKGIGDYSYDYKFDMSGTPMSGTAYVKGTKIRQDTTFAGFKAVMIIDYATKTAYTLIPNMKTATKVDMSSLKVSSPSDQVESLPANTRVVGTDTVDGKSATIYQFQQPDSSGKLWIWTDKGVPLKADVTASGIKATMEFTNYKFGTLDASLFEVPKDYTVTGVPSSPAGGSGPVPAPGAKP